MKWLSKRISPILKSVLLYSLLIGGSGAEVISSDRFLIKILDRTISFNDIQFQFRNIQALNCVYDNSFVVQYFGKGFLGQLNTFIKNFPTGDEQSRKFLQKNEKLLKQMRYLFKMLRYSENQRAEIDPSVIKLIRESVAANKCDPEILYKETLKTNFIGLLELEIYLRSRYGGQLKSQTSFQEIRPSVDLFVESIDKQFTHEYYW